jgi:hypothetical protein
MCPACAEWFAGQQRFEQALTERLTAGEASPKLWQGVLRRAGVVTPAPVRRRWFVFGGVLAAGPLAAVLLLAAILTLSAIRPPHAPEHSSELASAAADWHQRLLQGDVQPEVVSASDKEVEEHLRRKVSFPVHCPPRQDVNFALRGGGICRIKDREVVYIVGSVAQDGVSILVLDRASLDAFPHERDRLAQGGGRHRCREGSYDMVTGVTTDNVVIVIGSAPPETLEKLLTAYGSYHEG